MKLGGSLALPRVCEIPVSNRIHPTLNRLCVFPNHYWAALPEVLVEQVWRDFAAVFGELFEVGFVQPDVHGGGVAFVAGEVEIIGEFLAGGQARFSL